jgi:hypothetical protein
VSELIAWEFSADSPEQRVASGIATFRVGSRTVTARFDTFTAARDVHELMDRAYRLGRSDGMAEIKRVVEFHR